MPTRYIGIAGIAREFGVTRQAVQHWRKRHRDFPEPDAEVDGAPLWLPERLPEIKAWEASRPGQGAGGGRPGNKPASTGKGQQ